MSSLDVSQRPVARAVDGPDQVDGDQAPKIPSGTRRALSDQWSWPNPPRMASVA
jgi:hypothetical protein